MTTPPNQSLTFRSSLTRFCSLLLLCLSTWLPTALWAQPTGFVDQLFMGGWNNVVGMTFDENGRIYVYEKAGRVWIVDNGVRLPNPLIDISEEVGDWRDFGMLGFVLDPNFLSNGYIYLQYTVDRHHLLYHGTNDYDPNANEYFSATIGRITRYTANPAAGLTSVDYASRLVLLGETKETGVPSLHQSHGIGGLIFGTDGTLLACAGDGASYSSVDEGSASETYYAQALADGIIRPDENVGAYRCQQLTSLDGKILRLDPATGDGIASNPFYDGNAPRSAQSRVWSLGVRNPYRISKKPHTGSHFPGDGNPGVFYFGDVGWGNREELNIITTGGQNFGWPKYEGMTHQPGYNAAAYAPGSHERPVVDWRNTTPRALVDGTIYNVGSAQVPGPNFNGNASTGGVFYEGHDFPAEYHDTYFHADYGADWIRHFTFDTNNNPTGISDFVSNGGPIVFVASNHDYDGLFYVRYPSQIRRVVYTGSDNRPPVAQLAVDRDHGPSPLGIQFTGDQSFDPEFQSLSYAWDFGDGNTSSAANPFHTFSTGGGSPAQFTVSLTVSDPQGNTDQKSQVISLNNTPPVIVSTSLDNWSNFDPSTVSNLALNAVVTDAEHNANQLTWEWLTSLYHNDHHHDEPVDNAANTSTTLSPIGCDGATFWYRVTLTVTDAAGLSATYVKDLFPNCPGATQTINFAPISDRLTNAPPFNASASASSGLPVSIYVAEGPASIVNGEVNLVGVPGTVILRAVQSGDPTYAPAIAVEQSFTVMASPPPSCVGTGSITMESWTGIGGTAVNDIPLNTEPDATTEINIFEIPTDVQNDYGVRVRGYFCAPETGSYTFWIASDDNGELWLSSNDNPANKSLIATVPTWTNSRQWDKFPDQQSASIFLVQDQRYYIEALMKEASGGDNLAVGWRLPSGTLQRPIPGNFLSPWDPNPPAAPLQAEAGLDTQVGSSWKTITLDHTYVSPVVIATVQLDGSSDLPAVTRVRNAAGNSFELRVQNPSEQNLSNYTVHYLVVEEGVYNVAEHGIQMEAQRVNSNLTADIGNWSREGRTYANGYTNPVVLGQVMSHNDADWSVFWASTEASQFDPPSASSLAAGKHVGEDNDKTRVDETLGLVIIEAGTGTLEGLPFYAALGSDIVGGVDGQAGGYAYPLNGLSNADVALLGAMGMDGNNGGWPVLMGSAAIGNDQIKVAVDEDQISDPERAHTTEQFSYLVFATGSPPLLDQTIDFGPLADKETTAPDFNLSATASSGLVVSFSLVSGPATLNGNTLSLDGMPGTVTIRASQSGNATYHPAPAVERSFSVVNPSLLDQTIDFGPLADKETTDPDFSLSATASSGLTVSFSLVSGPATLNGNTVSLDGTPGTVTIRASQAGNASYNPAPAVERSFNVTQVGGNPPDYCASRGNQPWVEWIERVTFADIDHSSFKDLYGDYTNVSTNAERGLSYSIDLDPGLSWSGHQTDLFWRVWIDFNRDGDFEDVGEKVVEANNGNATVNTSLTIPAAAPLGATRMRVSMKKGAYPEPCEIFEQGEVEDYTVNVTDGSGGPTCSNVTAGGAISGNEMACDPFNPGIIANAGLPTGGSGALEYTWQLSTVSSNGPWAATNGDASSYNPAPITETTWYRRLARRSACTDYVGISNIVTKTVDNCSNPGVYCDARGNQPWLEWISRVTLGSIDNESFKDLYGDYTSLSTDLELGESYPLDLQPGLTWSGYQTNLFWRVWIDFNGDADFDDPGELVVEANNGRDPVSATISIPIDAVEGSTRMRVAMRRDQYPAACGQYDFGEVEDYSVQILTGQSINPFLSHRILALSAQRQGMSAQLEWMTNTGFRNDYFEIERSGDGQTFDLLDVVANRFGGTEAFAFDYDDTAPLDGPNYYRVKQVHLDGTFRYTETRLLLFSTEDERLIVFPNPAAGQVHLSIRAHEGHAALVQIYNALGQLMAERQVAQIGARNETFDLIDYPDGVYSITVKAEGHQRMSRQFVVQQK